MFNKKWWLLWIPLYSQSGIGVMHPFGAAKRYLRRYPNDNIAIFD